MTRPARPRPAQREALSGATARPTASVRPIAGPATAFISPPAVRRAVAGHGAEQGWAPSMTAGAIREGTALALAVAGLALQTPNPAGAAGAAPWARTVATRFDDLQALTGLERSGVRGALEVLAAAGVLRAGHDGAGLALTFASDAVWSSHPLLAAVPWALVSLALTRAAAPVRAAVVVFAELALETELAWRGPSPVGAGLGSWLGTGEADGSPPNAWLELTLKELSHRVHYHLSHVENALAGLETAGCLTRLRGPSGRALRLAPWTLGAAAPPAALLEAPAPLTPTTDQGPPTAGAPGVVSAGQVEIEFQGVRVVMAAGDTVDVSGRDADGRRVLRVRTEDGDLVLRPPRPR